MFHQVHDLSLDRDIQCRYRFVGDDEFRIDSESAGDADPLPLAAGKFVRVTLDKSTAQSHSFH